MPTTAPAARDAAPTHAQRAPRPRRRAKVVQDDTGVRLKQHAAQDRYLLDIVERLLAA